MIKPLDYSKIVTINDDEKYLRQISKEVDFNDPNLINDIEVLKKYCQNNDVLAMASVQLKIPKRILYLKNTDLSIIKKMHQNIATEEEQNFNEERILINPVIISKEGLTEYWESCASCLDNMGLVRRPYKIVVEYYDVYGEKHVDVFEGFESTVLSHEMDHLDGILHMDKSIELINMPQDERKIFRKTHGYDILYKEGNYDELIVQKHLQL